VTGTGVNLWEAFVEVSRHHPDRPAVIGPGDAVGYRRLAGAAASLADRLADRNVGEGDIVAIAVPVGPSFVVGALAALALGAAYLPIDVSAPVNRNAWILEHARPALVLTPGDVDTGPSEASADPGRHVPATGDDDPAYVIYTSGSTGRPKGVVVAARGVHNLLAAFERRAPLGLGARHSWWTSPGFDVSVYEMWNALLSGGTLIPVPDTSRRDIDATLDFLAGQRIDSTYLPPQFLTALRERVTAVGKPVPPLRRLLTGVEPIALGLLVDLRSHLPGAVVINGYGPTETTVCATLYVVRGPCDEPGQRAPIGTVIEGNVGFVLDERLEPVAPGQPGELCVAGRGLALGYLRDPERTAERFVPVPAASGIGSGLMYRTGDLVVADATGELTFLGRLDDQLKVDGVRIEPAETEAAMRGIEGVSDVAVLGRPTIPGGPSVLTAFVVLADAGADLGNRDDPWTEIRTRLCDELPAQAVPRRFVAVDRIPMTSDGKLDRAALPQFHDLPARAAQNDDERVVEAHCRVLLRHAPVSLLDFGFTELGGDSLLAARLAIALRAVTGRAVTAAGILEARTLAGLAAALSSLPEAPADVPFGAGRRGAEEPEVPLTAGQAGIWAAEMSGAAAPGAFHESVAVELTGDIDARRVTQALDAVLNRHPVFRGHVDEDWIRFVAGGEPVSAESRSTAPGQTVDQAWRDLLEEFQRPAFDLGKGPLVRAAVLAGAPGGVRILIVWHHIVVDAWSARVVLAELMDVLNGGEAPPDEEHGYAAYAHRQQRRLDSPEGKAAVRSAGDRVRAWSRPGDVELTPAPPDPCMVQELSAGPEVWGRVRDAARRNGTTTFAVTLAALLDPLRRIADTGGSFALAVADRDETADADAAGYFLTTVPFGPLPENGHDRPAWASDALRRAGEVIAEARTLAGIPFPSLMAELGLRDARPIAPLVVAWHPEPTVTLSVPGCAVRSLDVAPLAARWPWTVLLTDRGDLGLSGRIEFPRGAPGTLVTDFGLRLESTLDAFVRAL
jgi:amino acid adenylation domain-containing protein